MKIAMISSIPAVPSTAGNRRRILGLAHALIALGHEVYFVHLPSPISEAADPGLHQSVFGPDRFVQLPYSAMQHPAFRASRLRHKVVRRLSRFRDSDRSYYYGLDEFFPARLEESLKALHNRVRFDAVICEYVFSSRALLAFPKGVLKIIDTHDSFSDRHKLFKERVSYWYSLSSREQARGFKRSDIVLAIQDAERGLFSGQIALDTPAVVVVSHFLDISTPVTDYSSSDALFVGSSNAANVNSAKFFVKEVLPLVRKQIPAFKLVVAGSVCNQLDDVEGIVKLGIVDKLDKAAKIAPFSINPSLVGTGINIKLLEAMSFGIATITSDVGARGLDEEYQNGVLVTRDSQPRTFADAVCLLASDLELRRKLGQAAFDDAVRWNEAQLAALRAVVGDVAPSSSRHPLPHSRD